jgi:hypothetical protein
MEINKWIRERSIFIGLIALNLITIWHIVKLPFNYIFSAPLIPIIIHILTSIWISLDVSARLILITFYIFGPITLYYLVIEVTGRKMSATLAAILFSLPVFHARYEALVELGDGAHIASLTLIPLAAYRLLKFLKTGDYTNSIYASVLVLLVSLISPFGFFVLLGVMGVITFSEMLLGSGRVKFLRLCWVVIVAIGFSAFWYNPSFVQANLMSSGGRAVVAAISNLIPISFVVLPVLATLGYLIFDKRAHLQPLSIAFGLTILFGLISFAGSLAPFAVSTQRRYLPELLFSLSFLWGVMGTFVYDLIGYLPESEYFPIPRGLRPTIQKVLVITLVVVGLLISILVPYKGSEYRRLSEPDPKVVEASIYEVTRIRKLSSITSIVIGYGISIATIVGVVLLQRVVFRRLSG